MKDLSQVCFDRLEKTILKGGFLIKLTSLKFLLENHFVVVSQSEDITSREMAKQCADRSP